MRLLRVSRLLRSTVLFVSFAVAAAELPPPVELPKPTLDSPSTLVSALKARRTSRDFSPAPLPLQALSDLLWAASGVNRDDGRRTAATGRQDFVKVAPVSLVFVADLARMTGASAEDRDLYAATDAAFVSQNVYLWCAATGLSTGVRGYVDRPALAKTLGLRNDQRIILAQSVGYPKK